MKLNFTEVLSTITFITIAALIYRHLCMLTYHAFTIKIRWGGELKSINKT